MEEATKDKAYVVACDYPDEAEAMITYYLYPNDNLEPTESTTKLIKAYFFDTKEMAESQLQVWRKEYNARIEEVDMKQFNSLNRVSGFFLVESEGTVIEVEKEPIEHF